MHFIFDLPIFKIVLTYDIFLRNFFYYFGDNFNNYLWITETFVSKSSWRRHVLYIWLVNILSHILVGISMKNFTFLQMISITIYKCWEICLQMTVETTCILHLTCPYFKSYVNLYLCIWKIYLQETAFLIKTKRCQRSNYYSISLHNQSTLSILINIYTYFQKLWSTMCIVSLTFRRPYDFIKWR